MPGIATRETTKFITISDSANEEVQLARLRGGKLTIGLDLQTPLKKLINSKKSPVGKSFKEKEYFIQVSPTVISLLHKEDPLKLAGKIEDETKELILSLAKSVNATQDTISQAFCIISLDPNYEDGNGYKISAKIVYR